MTAAAIVAVLAMSGVRASYIAFGGERWRARSDNPYVGAAWGVGLRPVADRDGRVFIVTGEADGAPVRRTAVPASDLLARLVDLNYFDHTGLAERRGLLGTKSLPAFRTSINIDLQRKAAELLAGRAGVVAAVDPADGAVLALAANGVDTSRGLPAVPPGSAFKLAVWGGALDAGVVRANESFPREPAYGEVRNFGGATCGGSIPQVLARSCNAATVRAADELGRAGLAQAAQKMGFNGDAVLVGVEPSVFPSPSSLGSRVAWHSTAIGQFDVRLDPLTAAAIAAAVGSGGRQPKPTLIEDDRVHTRAVVSAATADVLAEGMEMAVSSGTASGSGVKLDEKVAAKTGTAESGKGYDHAWTLGFGPVGAPRIAVAVVLFGSAEARYVGGHDAAPVALAMIKAAQ